MEHQLPAQREQVMTQLPPCKSLHIRISAYPRLLLSGAFVGSRPGGRAEHLSRICTEPCSIIDGFRFRRNRPCTWVPTAEFCGQSRASNTSSAMRSPVLTFSSKLRH